MAVKYEEEEKPEVQLTSMMDCIFLMLIFFLVSSQLKKIEKEVPLELPVADTAVSVKAPPDLVKIFICLFIFIAIKCYLEVPPPPELLLPPPDMRTLLETADALAD